MDKLSKLLHERHWIDPARGKDMVKAHSYFQKCFWQRVTSKWKRADAKQTVNDTIDTQTMLWDSKGERHHSNKETRKSFMGQLVAPENLLRIHKKLKISLFRKCNSSYIMILSFAFWFSQIYWLKMFILLYSRKYFKMYLLHKNVEISMIYWMEKLTIHLAEITEFFPASSSSLTFNQPGFTNHIK